MALLVLLLAAPAAAQSLIVGVDAAAAPAAFARVAEVPRGEGTVGFGVRLAARPVLDLDGRLARAFGPLGTLVLDGEAAARFGPMLDGRVRAGARGALGPLAVRLEGSAWSAPRTAFDPLADAGPETFPAGWAGALEVDGRVSRNWLLGGRARLARDAANGSLDFDVGAWLRARRALAERHDLRLRTRARFASQGRGAASVGVEVLWQRGRAPEWRTGLGFGRGPHGWGPGLTFEGRASLADGPRLDWALRLEPYAVADLPYRGELGASFALPRGELELRGVAGLDGAGRPEGALRAAWRQPWPGPNLN